MAKAAELWPPQCGKLSTVVAAISPAAEALWREARFELDHATAKALA